MPQKIDEESLDALLTPIEGVLLLKLTSAKSAECEAKRRKDAVTVGKYGHADHITATVPVGERGRARLKTVFDMLFFHVQIRRSQECRAHVVRNASLTNLFPKPSFHVRDTW